MRPCRAIFYFFTIISVDKFSGPLEKFFQAVMEVLGVVRSQIYLGSQGKKEDNINLQNELKSCLVLKLLKSL